MFIIAFKYLDKNYIRHIEIHAISTSVDKNNTKLIKIIMQTCSYLLIFLKLFVKYIAHAKKIKIEDPLASDKLQGLLVLKT